MGLHYAAPFSFPAYGRFAPEAGPCRGGSPPDASTDYRPPRLLGPVPGGAAHALRRWGTAVARAPPRSRPTCSRRRALPAYTRSWWPTLQAVPTERWWARTLPAPIRWPGWNPGQRSGSGPLVCGRHRGHQGLRAIPPDRDPRGTRWFEPDPGRQGEGGGQIAGGYPGDRAGAFGGVPNAHEAYSNALVGGDPVTPAFQINRDQPARMRMTNPFGTTRGSTFALHGHNWLREPFVWSGGSRADIGRAPPGAYPSGRSRKAAPQFVWVPCPRSATSVRGPAAVSGITAPAPRPDAGARPPGARWRRGSDRAGAPCPRPGCP